MQQKVETGKVTTGKENVDKNRQHAKANKNLKI